MTEERRRYKKKPKGEKTEEEIKKEIRRKKETEDVISVTSLRKEFILKQTEKGFLKKVRSIFVSKKRKVIAVDNISFNIKKGELVAFIGPNGAGKSTTLKMLSGILFPTSGIASILGFNPQKQRKKLAFRIGTVFGQRSQLWFHLPARDSFTLFSKIYEIDKTEYKKRVHELITRFEIEDIVDTPVRKLSLGERMRCELVLSLLHKPDILFLDEPTIGLDVIAKKKLREHIKQLNIEEKLTVILTSHDMDDVESICERMIIINRGSIVYDGTIADIRKKYLTNKIVSVVSEEKIQIDLREGMNILSREEFSAKIEINTTKIPIKTAIDLILKNNTIADITIEEEPIEEIIEKIYRE